MIRYVKLRHVKTNNQKASQVFQADYFKTAAGRVMVHAPNAISCSRAWASPHFKGATWPSTRCFEMFAEGSSNHEAPTSCVIQRYL